MVKQQVLGIFISVALLGMTGSCVSVNIGPSKPTPSVGVEYVQPTKPFEELPLKDADRAWQNKGNGNTISYLSICNDPSDPSLETARTDLLNSLSQLKVVGEKE